MRFRLGEDERVYSALRTELYLRIATLPPQTASEVLRNYGKLEALLFWEGVRQGLALAAMHDPADEMQQPTMLHASLYGDADTPLTRVEQERCPGWALHPWLQSAPVSFAPMTLAEAVKRYGQDASVAAPGKALAKVESSPDPSSSLAAVTGELDELRAATESLLAQMQSEQRSGADAGHMGREAPAFLDRVRDELLHQISGGWKPKSWPEVVMRLHLSMRVDASFLDLQLSSDMGRAVLGQAGLAHLFPGLGVLVNEDGAFGTVKENL